MISHHVPSNRAGILPSNDLRRDRRDAVFTVERPWGRFQQFSSGEPVTVKTITVEPGQRLSLQRHQHRAEMWHVLGDPVRVTVGDRTWDAQQGELVWVPPGALHRLGSADGRPGLVLELAFGDFDEADIERLQDDYTR